MLTPKAVGDYICLRKTADALGEDLEEGITHVYNVNNVIEELTIEEDTYVFVRKEDILGVLTDSED